MTARQQQDARHREVVRAYYATGHEAPLGPMLAELSQRLAAFLMGKGLRDAAQLEDLVQETLATALTELRTRAYAFAGSVAAWAVSICWHQFLQAKRSPKAIPSRPGADENPFLLLPTHTATPAEVLPVKEEDQRRAGAVVEAVTHAVLRLDPNARACVLLCYYHGLSEASAAAQLGLTEAKFKARLRRGLTSLREWGAHHQHLSPEPDVYAALPHLHSGDLFREPLCLVA